MGSKKQQIETLDVETVQTFGDQVRADVSGPGFRCRQCLHEWTIWQQTCPDCDAPLRWIEKKQLPRQQLIGSLYTPAKIGAKPVPRLLTCVPVFDRFCGGGLPRGTTTIVAGQKGTGKSTLVLQSMLRITPEIAKRPMYATAEESNIELSNRLYRLGYKYPDRPLIKFTKSVPELEELIVAIRPDYLGIDSAQKFYDPRCNGKAEGTKQTVNFVNKIYALCKKYKMTVVLVSRMTRTNQIAGGPQVSYEVDQVYEVSKPFETNRRVFSSQKDRFSFSVATNALLTKNEGFVAFDADLEEQEVRDDDDDADDL